MKKHVKLLCLLLAVLFLCGCATANQSVKLDPQNPVTITVWHYYNGAVLNAFEAIVRDFNETVGMEQGIIVEIQGFGSVAELEKSVIASVNKEIGSLSMPNIFASYADTAYEAEKLGLLADLGNYFTTKEQEQYLSSYIDEGRIGLNGELRIFPIAKSTEIFMINETDWLPFANAMSLSYNDLSTMEGLAKVAELYYEWSGGKSFFGRDSMANLFVLASMQFGTEIFSVKNGEATININSEVMRKIWDYYYVPYISGYYSSYGRFRSDDAKVGDILAYVGSTSSASYFPTEVTVDDNIYPVTANVLPAPLFEGGERVMVQQGAGMVVLKAAHEEEYASVAFLKWFTDTETNIEFSSMSGYMPVKNEAMDYDLIKKNVEEAGINFNKTTDDTLKTAITEIKTSKLYTNKAFDGGTTARAILDNSLQDKAESDRASVLKLIESGSPHEEAVASFNTDEQFNAWLLEFSAMLNSASQK